MQMSGIGLYEIIYGLRREKRVNEFAAFGAVNVAEVFESISDGLHGVFDGEPIATVRDVSAKDPQRGAYGRKKTPDLTDGG